MLPEVAHSGSCKTTTHCIQMASISSLVPVGYSFLTQCLGQGSWLEGHQWHSPPSHIPQGMHLYDMHITHNAIWKTRVLEKHMYPPPSAYIQLMVPMTCKWLMHWRRNRGATGPPRSEFSRSAWEGAQALCPPPPPPPPHSKSSSYAYVTLRENSTVDDNMHITLELMTGKIPSLHCLSNSLTDAAGKTPAVSPASLQIHDHDYYSTPCMRSEGSNDCSWPLVYI